MPYKIVFASKKVEHDFEKTLQKIPRDYQTAIMQRIYSLQANPRPEGKQYKKLKNPPVVASLTAAYRLRVGYYRVLYDIDEQNKKMVLLKLIKRTEQTYK